MTKKQIKERIEIHLNAIEKEPHILTNDEKNCMISFIRGEVLTLYSIYNEDAFYVMALERLDALEK